MLIFSTARADGVAMGREQSPVAAEPLTLLEREQDVALAAKTIERARAGAGALALVEGPPGIGKTALLERIRSLAVGRGMDTLRARAGEMERELAYGVVRDLFEPALRRSDPGERKALLDGAAGLAAPLVQGRPPRAGDAFAVMHGLYWLVSNLAERGPLLIEVDDAHWADPPSLGFLHYLARRLEDLPVLVALAARPGVPGGEETLRRIASEPVTSVIRPAPLSADGTTELVRSLLSADADDGFCRACQAATGGNPFLLHELLRELAAESVEPVAAEASRVREIAPKGVARAVFLRLARLSASAVRLARALAVLGERADLRHAAALAGVDEEQAIDAVDALVAAHVLAGTQPLAFLHPLVRQVIYQESPPGERALSHARAALLLHEGGAPDEQVASHLLLAEPKGERWRVEVLRRAAGGALRAGAPGVAVTYLRRALAEPPDPGARPALRLELGVAESRAGDPAALETLALTLTHRTDARARASAALELAQATEMVAADPAAAAAVLDEATAELDGVEPDLALRVEAELIGNARIYPESRARARARLARLRERAFPPRPASVPLLANLALDALETGEPAEVVRELAEQALSGGWLLAEESPMLFSFAANSLTWSDHLELAARHWDEALAEGRRRGSLTLFVFASGWRAYLDYRRGRISEAEAEARGIWDLILAQWPYPMAIAYSSAFLADILIERGRLGEAAVVVAEGDPDFSPFLWDTRGRLRHLDGRFAEALDDFRSCARMLEGRGGRDCPGIIPWRSGAALAHAALGEADQARTLVHEEVELARGQRSARALGIALRAAGLVEGGDRGSELLRESVSALDRSPALLERARALTDLGAALRRGGSRSHAREPLRRGLDLAHRCGATALAERARQELLATGARPRRPVLTGADALTPSERRVALLAAEGKTNRQIAQALFVSMRTVAVHLSHAYQKLGISGRNELADALSGRPRGRRSRPA
jgi:DNA-binding CsgD family transcriptional regulator